VLAEWDVGVLPISFLEGGDGGFIILSSWSQRSRYHSENC